MTEKHIVRSAASSAGLLFCIATASLAQSPTGIIRGTVVDPSGALIPRARVTISNARGYSRTLKSGPAGSFEIPRLAPGDYSLSITANGFTPALEGGVRVVGDKVTHQNIKLGISVDQSIQVVAYDADAPGSQRRAII